MTNFFKLHTNNFHDAADFINQHCISFAGKSVRAPHSPWAFTCFANAFSHCDDAVSELGFDCTVSAGPELIHCTAWVGTNGAVRMVPVQ